LRVDASQRFSAVDRRWRLGLALATAVVLGVGVRWGLPGLPNGWAADELNPFSAYEGLQQHFAGGWHDAVYPPLHIYLLALAEIPVLLLFRVLGLTIHDPAAYTALYVICRLVSVAAGVGIVLLVHACARRLFSTTAAALAGVAVLAVPPFVYYGKMANVDVPYVFWFLVSMIFYLRAFDGHARRDYLGLTIAAACAVGTKDQAYALYPLLPLPLWASYVAAQRHTGDGGGWWTRLRRWPMPSAAIAGVAALALINNLPFNWSGAMERFHNLVGPASQPYREFPATLAGQIDMLRLGVRHLRWAFQWPGLAALATGLGAAAARARRNPRALALLVPVASYWIFFIMPIGYHYDRFLLPVFVILAVYAGHGASVARDAIARWASPTAAATVLAALVISQLAVGVSVDLWMVRDARYAARGWMATHIPAGARVLGIGIGTYLPHLDGYDAVVTPHPNREDLARQRPAAVVVSSAYGRARLAGDRDALDLLRALETGQAGYRLAAEFDAPPPRAVPDMRGIRSNFDKISPRILIYLRTE
jgi:hypothetical protein